MVNDIHLCHPGLDPRSGSVAACVGVSLGLGGCTLGHAWLATWVGVPLDWSIFAQKTSIFVLKTPFFVKKRPFFGQISKTTNRHMGELRSSMEKTGSRSILVVGKYSQLDHR